jgi:hypothetical protein
MGDDVHERVARIESKIEDIHKALMGNGRPGLIEEFAQVKGAVSLIKWGLGVVGLPGLGALILWISKQ